MSETGSPSIRPRRFPALPVLFLLLLVSLAAGIAFAKAWRLNHRLSRSLEGVTKIRVWAAGIRGSSGSFCPCATVPKPECMLYESGDPRDLASLASAIRARPHFAEDPLIQSCGTLTIDFLRDDQIILSLHLMGSTVRSTFVSWWQIPISGGSREDIETWMTDRGLRAKADAAREEFFRSMSK